MCHILTWQDIKVGKPAKPQLARAVKGPEEAYNIMKGRPFVVETKFDGRLCLPSFAFHQNYLKEIQPP